jgi:hypothetical protein
VTYGYCKTNPAASVTTKKEPVKVKDVLDDDEFGTVVALLMATLEIKSLYDMWMQLVALLGGGFAGTGALAGAVTSVAVTVLVKAYTPLHFMLYGVVSVLTCIVVGYVGSLVLPGRRGDLTGLTVYTRQDDAASP